MAFQVTGLDYAQFAPLFALTDAQLAERKHRQAGRRLTARISPVA